MVGRLESSTQWRILTSREERPERERQTLIPPNPSPRLDLDMLHQHPRTSFIQKPIEPRNNTLRVGDGAQAKDGNNGICSIPVLLTLGPFLKILDTDRNNDIFGTQPSVNDFLKETGMKTSVGLDAIYLCDLRGVEVGNPLSCSRANVENDAMREVDERRRSGGNVFADAGTKDRPEASEPLCDGVSG